MEDINPISTLDYSIIIGVYDGVNWINHIIDAAYNQNISPRDVTLWINNNIKKPIDIQAIQDKYPNIKCIYCTENYGVYARFSSALLSPSKYIMVLDDDTIPGKEWAQNCEDTYKIVGDNAILGARGIRLKNYFNSEAYGNEKNTTEITEVDLVGHSWIAQKKHILSMFEEYPQNIMNGEDIHLSAINQIKYGTKTYVPAQPNTNLIRKGSIKPHLGLGPGRISMRLGAANHFGEREAVNKYWISKGWKSLDERNKSTY